jgi:ankyrin repeat protein
MRTLQTLGGAALIAACLAGVAAAQARSEIADAAQRGDRAAVQKFIQAKANVDAPQVDGATALHWAVYREDDVMVDMLIRAGADVAAANRAGMTPLAMASMYGRPTIIDRLLRGGADAKALGPNGETMVMFAARNGNPEAIRVLVEAGADVNAREPLRGTTALMWAAEQKHADAVKALLAAGADASAKSGGAGLPRNYMAGRVNTRVVDEARERRLRAQQAGRTYDEQFEWERQNGVPMLGQRGLGTPLGADGQPLQGGRQGGAQQGGAQQGGAQAGAAAAGPQGAGAGPQAQAGGGRGRGAGGGGRAGGAGAAAGRQGGARGQGQGQAQQQQEPDTDDTEVVVAGLVGGGGGGLTPLIFAAREGDLESARALIDAGANVNQPSEYGWTPLLTAVNNRNYQLARLLVDRGADVNLANKGGWTPLYLATDNRNIEGGDYPVPKPDMDHLELIQLLLEKGANPNARIKDNTLTRTIFTMQWFLEDGATPFIRASQSSDTELMKLLLKYGADPKVATNFGDTALTAAGGIGWVPGVTYERSPKENVEAIRLLLDLGVDPNAANNDGRTALMGAAMKGRNDAVLLLVERGADLAQKDRGSRDTDKATSAAAGHRWQAIDYADGLVRVGVQSAVEYPETSALIRKLMEDKGLPTPPKERNILSVCVVWLCAGSN